MRIFFVKLNTGYYISLAPGLLPPSTKPLEIRTNFYDVRISKAIFQEAALVRSSRFDCDNVPCGQRNVVLLGIISHNGRYLVSMVAFQHAGVFVSHLTLKKRKSHTKGEWATLR